MTALIVAIILHQPCAGCVLPVEVRFPHAVIYATRDMCERQMRDTANEYQDAYPDAKIRIACVPAVPGE
jgi:hypothetical protein